MLGFRRRAESGGHDGGLVRCCDMEGRHLSPPADEGAAPQSSEAHLHPQASMTARRSHRRTNPRFLLRSHPEKEPPDRSQIILLKRTHLKQILFIFAIQAFRTILHLFSLPVC